MIVDTYEALPTDCSKAQITIVGAGAVGLALGLSLSRAGISVLILEAGERSPPSDFQKFNTGTVVGKPHRGLKSGRMRAVGGTTKLWGGQLVSFSELDFEGLPEAAASGWPINYKTVKPYIDQAFEFLGVSASGRDEQAIWQRFAKSAPELGHKLQLGMNIWLPKPDFSQLFAHELATCQRLCVLTGAPVEALNFDSSGTQVKSVRIGGVAPRIIPVKKLVLASGTFENVGILLRAGARNRESVLTQLPKLGHSFVDHLHGIAGEIVVKDKKALSSFFDNIYFEGRKYGIKIRASDHFRASVGIANCAGTINPGVTPKMLLLDAITLMKRVVGGEMKSISRLIRDGFTMAQIFAPLAWRYLVQRRSASLMSKGVFLGLELEQLPTIKSRIELEPSVSPETAPVRLHWDFDGREIDAAAAFCAEIDEQFRGLGIGHIVLDPRILARDPAFLDSCHDSNHHIGGAVMGRSPEDGVVDADNKVFGSENLYVAGAATFPSGSFANPTLTAIALALRLSDHLRAQC